MALDINILNSIPLDRVLEEVMGGEPNIDGIKNKWRIDTGDNIQTSDSDRWYNFNQRTGGIGAFSLVKHWLESQNISKNKINSEIIKILKPFCDEMEKLELKEELEKTLPNVGTQTPKIKV